jgi:hypothetical protein
MIHGCVSNSSLTSLKVLHLEMANFTDMVFMYFKKKKVYLNIKKENKKSYWANLISQVQKSKQAIQGIGKRANTTGKVACSSTNTFSRIK